MIEIYHLFQYELEQLKSKLEKIEKERNEYKTQSEKLENRVSVEHDVRYEILYSSTPNI